MSYDFDGLENKGPPQTPNAPIFNPKDLEHIVMSLELAAILLTCSPEDVFTERQLIDQALELGEGLDEKDLRIVIPHLKSIRRVPFGFRLV